MALSLASLKYLTKLQHLFPLPYTFDIVDHVVIPNSKYKSKRHKYKRLIAQLTALFFLLFSFTRLLYLYSHRKTYTYHKQEQFVVYTLILCLTVIGYSVYRTVENKTEEMQFSLVQRCKLLPLPLIFEGSNVPLKYRLADMFICLFSVGTISAPVLTLGIPFAINYGPVQVILLWEHITPKFNPNQFFFYKYGVKIFASFLYGYAALYALGMFLSIMLYSIAFGEGLQLYSDQFYVRPLKVALSRRPENPPETFPVNRARYGSVYFSKCFQKYQNCRLIVYIAREMTSTLFFITASVGVLLAGCTGYCAIKMYNELPILTYLACPVLFDIVVTFILTYLADKPNRNGLDFHRFWKHLVVGELERRMMRACPEFGYSLEPFRNAKTSLGLIVRKLFLRLQQIFY